MKENEKDLLLSLLQKVKDEGLLNVYDSNDKLNKIDWVGNVDNKITIKLKEI